MSRSAGRSTRMATPSVTSTWRRTNDTPVAVTAGNLEKEQFLDDALDEYCRLREQGGNIRATQFCERYPSYRHSLRRLIDVHEAMENYPVLETTPWPALLSEFLGFEILHELGVGAIARVYLAAECEVGGRLVAIKVAKGGGYEAETLGKLSHRNVVPVYSVKQDDETGMTAVCMPYYGSSTLADLLDLGFQNGQPPARAATIFEVAQQREQLVGYVERQEETVLPEDPILSRKSYVDGIAHLGCQMAEALEYTHEQGILHRDLKPSNVLLTPDGVPMLLDFNLATDMEMELPTLGGTLPYMPPEQIQDVHLKPFGAHRVGDPRSDIFSLGVILYELLTGTLPFGSPEPTSSPKDAAKAHLKGQQTAPVPIRELNPAVAPCLERIIGRCLSLDVEQRPATAGDLVVQLQDYFAPRQRFIRWSRAHFTTIMTAAALMLVACSLLSWHLATRPPHDVRQYLAGVADIERGEYREAIEHFDRVMVPDESRIPFLYARGLALQKLGAQDKALMDFVRIANRTDEPAVLELAGYSAAQDVKTLGLAAICYELLCAKPEVMATTYLSRAYCHLGESPNPESIDYSTSKAISLNPKLHLAYQLRAMGYLVKARRSPDEFEEAMERAVADMDEAIRLGPVDAKLLTDAVAVYRQASGPELEERLRKLVQAGLQAGAPRNFLQPLMRAEQGEEWLQDLLALAAPEAEFSAPIRAARYVSPPDYARALALMRRYAQDHRSLVME